MSSRYYPVRLNFNSWNHAATDYRPWIVPGLPKANLIKLSDDGIPLFPNIDTDKILPDQVASVLEEYITALWSTSITFMSHEYLFNIHYCRESITC